MRRVTSATVALSLAIGVLISMGSPAQAEKRRRSQSAGSVKNTDIIAEVSRVKISGRHGATNNDTVKLTSQNSNWEPPACWYEPKTTPKQLKEKIEGLKPKERKKGGGEGPLTGNIDPLKIADAVRGQITNIYEDYYQTDKYKNYNIDKQGEGMFWEGVKNPNRKDDPAADECSQHAHWVDKGQTPENIPLAVTPEVLAQYAYEELPIPRTAISLNPKGKQTVNLDTWVWADKKRFKKVSVTASLENPAISATTTAKPVSLTLEPGTEDAKTYPGSGTCKLGEPYSAGKKDQTPPCGVRYLRATSKNGTYPLKATLTWEISWKGSDGSGATLPAGTFSTTEDLTVKEIQSIVRD
ncbi:hypothetical protein [Streptomyces reniochalinae]|uniref:Secreted protein n=1 Tax=Streptomyces reniochalinae TaxID=2250578 RepID=A0A367EGP2_9ACTN|nr:hypothetical protein [Streptomyces reniochalinae]RCG16527.1 hypothetical protein DQ392_20540 [Streptomyces reniochalinae]